MNKKRKVLTLAALAVFGVIIALHYTGGEETTRGIIRETYIPDVRLPIFALGVFYAGLFVILGDNKRK